MMTFDSNTHTGRNFHKVFLTFKHNHQSKIFKPI